MVPAAIREALALGESAIVTRSDRALEEAVREFAHTLEGIAGGSSPEHSDDLAALHTMAELVIERIESAVAGGMVHGGRCLALVEGVYDIRRALEEIHWWRRRTAAIAIRS
jgi:hypothetical protein